MTHQITTSNSMQQTIRKNFLELLEEKPLNKITVNELAARCGINRNSFYYHYQSLPALLEDIVVSEADQVIRSHPSISSIEECLDCAVEYAAAHRRLLLHVYQSVRRDLFEVPLWRICRHAVNSYLNTVLQNTQLSDTDYHIVSNYYQCICFGEVIHWMESGMKEDIQTQFHRLCQLKQGAVEELIRRCDKK